MAIEAQFPFCGGSQQDWMDYGCGGLNQYFNVEQQKQQQLQQCNMHQLQNYQLQRNQNLFSDNTLVSASKNNCNTSNLSMGTAYDEKQRQEIDHYIRLQNERLRLVLQEQKRRQLGSLLKKLESKALPILKQKDEEIAQAAKRTVELGEFLKKLEFENHTWQRMAQENEAMVVSLNNTIEQLRENSSGCFNNGAEDAESCCDVSSGAEEGFLDRKMLMVCKGCNSRNSCILFLPCRHLCSCKACVAFLDSCPVCQTPKKASIEALMGPCMWTKHLGLGNSRIKQWQRQGILMASMALAKSKKASSMAKNNKSRPIKPSKLSVYLYIPNIIALFVMVSMVGLLANSIKAWSFLSRSSYCSIFSTFGAVLDMVTDRPGMVFLSLLALDIGSHWLQMYSTFLLGKASHKDVKDSTNWLFKAYYGNRMFMAYCCVACEVLYISLFLLAQNETEKKLMDVLKASITEGSLVSVVVVLSLFGWAIKQLVNIIQMKTAADALSCIRLDNLQSAMNLKHLSDDDMTTGFFYHVTNLIYLLLQELHMVVFGTVTVVYKQNISKKIWHVLLTY
ncbi:hypothetical protein NC653_023653 [Populus alba x Populus x berolinensis]|uniref:RING-type domain-containing protein n=1 Tax=Populus alba x Populus x berolinensis TaxID=444605 RepID=A0AAD6QB85_9ROSI|nr:hypothetical protein NC653_023653 [Populus alba x Populus x berolinensis]